MIDEIIKTRESILFLKKIPVVLVVRSIEELLNEAKKRHFNDWIGMTPCSDGLLYPAYFMGMKIMASKAIKNKSFLIIDSSCV